MAQLGFMRGNLHRDGIEMSVIATDMRLDKRFELFRTCHDGPAFTTDAVVI